MSSLIGDTSKASDLFVTMFTARNVKNTKDTSFESCLKPVNPQCHLSEKPWEILSRTLVVVQARSVLVESEEDSNSMSEMEWCFASKICNGGCLRCYLILARNHESLWTRWGNLDTVRAEKPFLGNRCDLLEMEKAGFCDSLMGRTHDTRAILVLSILHTEKDASFSWSNVPKEQANASGIETLTHLSEKPWKQSS